MRIVFYILCFILFLYSDDRCIGCHNIEEFDKKNHNFSCVDCHILPKDRDIQNFSGISHKKVISNPASFKYVDIFCGRCHSDYIDKFKKSSHYTHQNEINITRKIFKADGNYTIHNLPLPKKNITNPKDIVDDILRRKCLKCHIENKGSGELGMYRGKGCMSCHSFYNELGVYNGKDTTIKNKKIFSNTHKLYAKPPMSSCMSCHNKEFVGGEYSGLFPHDYDKAYRSPLSKDGYYPKRLYGIDHHHLNSDIHYQKGMVCADCHKSNSKTLSCTDCHQNISKKHHKDYHQNLSCSSCHSSWAGSHYELNLLRDDTKNYKQWKRLQVQEDAWIEQFLYQVLKQKKDLSPKMPDYLTNEIKDGIWYSGWRFRRWENILLGNDKDGKIKHLRPIFQYRVSYKDKNGNMVFDDINKIGDDKIEAFKTFTPHTIQKHSKSCEMCHENDMVLDKNYIYKDILKGKVIDGSHLSDKQIKKLTSDRYKKTRASMIDDR
jgi:hypothetical protein